MRETATWSSKETLAVPLLAAVAAEVVIAALGTLFRSIYSRRENKNMTASHCIIAGNDPKNSTRYSVHVACSTNVLS